MSDSQKDQKLFRQEEALEAGKAEAEEDVCVPSGDSSSAHTLLILHVVQLPK